jgi:predicted HNH restriction endonuclease
MQKRDVIYVKEGSEVVGRGTIVSNYEFSPGSRLPWPHQRRVNWQEDFAPTKTQIGDNQHYAVRPILVKDIRILGRKINAAQEKTKQDAAIEGEIQAREAQFRVRNRGLIEQRKVGSDYCCEVCGLNFEHWYGRHGHKYIIAHHIEPLSHRKRPSRTHLEDIALVCANCHAMLHRESPPILLKRLRSQPSVRRFRELIRGSR